MDGTVNKKRGWKPGMRVMAGVLAAVMVISLGANAAIAIRIDPGDGSQAATNYLVENTDYVNDGRLGRIREKVKSLTQPKGLEDYYRQAGTRIAETDYEGALESITSCLALYTGGDLPLHLDLLMKKGCLQVLLERGEDALDTLDEVLALDPNQPDAYLVKAQIYAQQEDVQQLADSLLAYLNLVPQDQEVRGLLAQALFAEEDYSGAASQYQQIIQEAPEEADTTQMEYLYALTNIQIGRYAEAERTLKRLVGADDTLQGIYYYIGMCQMSRGEYADAAVNMTASIQQGSMLQLSQYSRGVCRLMNENEYEAALEDLRKAADYTGSDRDGAIAAQAHKLLDELAAAQAEAQRIAEEEAARLKAEAEAAEQAAREAEEQRLKEEQDSGTAAEQQTGEPQGTSTAEMEGEEPNEDLPAKETEDARAGNAPDPGT